MTLLASCQSFQILCDASFAKNRCRCRCYDTGKLQTVEAKKCKKDWDEYFYGLPETHPVNYEVEMCEGIMGFRVEEVAKDIIPSIREERARCEDRGK